MVTISEKELSIIAQLALEMNKINPSDLKLRKAAEEALKKLEQLRNRRLLGENDFRVLWNLRAALEKE